MMKTLPVMVCSVCLLAACGQNGPLYLPEAQPAAKPFSACDVPDAPCREQTPTPSTESNAP